jgi:hypothetical protein
MKYYDIYTSSKLVHTVSAEQLELYLDSDAQQLMLEDIHGLPVLVNKAFVAGASVNVEKTQESYRDRMMTFEKETDNGTMVTAEQAEQYRDLRENYLKFTDLDRKKNKKI